LIPDAGDDFEENKLFIKGDHWQSGGGWIGPMLEKGESGFATALAKVQRSFIARNVIAEIVDNHLAGVLGREPQYTVSLRRPLEKGDEPNDEEQALIDEATALLTSWWDANQAVASRYADDERIRRCSIHQLLQEAGKSLLSTSRSMLRVVIDPDAIEIDEEGTAVIRPFQNVEEALSFLYVSHPSPDQATVALDARLNSAGVYLYKAVDKTTGKETGAEHLEICYLNDAGETIIRLARPDESTLASEETSPLNLGGRLTMHEMERPLFLTEPIRLLQKAINLTLTLASRNLVSGGFLERLFLNTAKPGDWVWDEAQQRFIHQPADTIRLGEGTTNFLYGLPIYNENREIVGYTNPEVLFRDPVDSKTFIDAERAFYRAMLEEAKQLHTLISGDATASGESRIQAKDTFRNSLLLTKPQFDAAVAWMLETLLALASDLAGAPGRFESLRINVNTQVTLGMASGDEIRSIIESYSEGLISRPEAMRRLGVDDVPAMAEAIDSDAMHLLMWLQKKAEVYTAFASSGTLDEAAILEMLGISEETVAALTGGEKSKAEIAKAWQDAGATLEESARRAGLSPEEVRDIMRTDQVESFER
jgi:hypothetical protein